MVKHSKPNFLLFAKYLLTPIFSMKLNLTLMMIIKLMNTTNNTNKKNFINFYNSILAGLMLKYFIAVISYLLGIYKIHCISI